LKFSNEPLLYQCSDHSPPDRPCKIWDLIKIVGVRVPAVGRLFNSCVRLLGRLHQYWTRRSIQVMTDPAVSKLNDCCRIKSSGYRSGIAVFGSLCVAPKSGKIRRKSQTAVSIGQCRSGRSIEPTSPHTPVLRDNCNRSEVSSFRSGVCDDA